MSEAKRILEMIEGVSPDDVGTLDEIDARVWCWITKHQKCPHRVAVNNARVKKYTRSRDALKSIRPDGWNVQISYGRSVHLKHKTTALVSMISHKDGHEVTSPNKTDTALPTEELAELHAIIQAIEWERSHEKRD